MRITPALAVVKHPRSTTRYVIARGMVTALGTLGMLASSTRTSEAQASTPQASAWEFRLTSGALVPTGNQRNSLKGAEISAAQLSWLVRPSVAVTGTFGWARSRDRASLNAPKLNVFTSDLGVEVRPTHWFADRRVSISPFAGLGAGARSYDYRKVDADATHNLAGYGAVGADFGVDRVGVRFEARDYVSGFKPLVGAGKSDARNDVVMTVALNFNRRRAARD